MNEQSILNLAYQSGLLVTLNLTYSLASRKLFKMKSIEMGKLDFSDIGRFTAVMALSILTRDYLIKNKIIPAEIHI